jgi:hypothetical protein
MRSGKLIATNDVLVLEFIQDPDYDISPNGQILTRISKTGKRFLDHSRFRIAGNVNSKGYKDVRYKGKRLNIHRIIYAKFLAGMGINPPLESDLVINHKDGNPENNSVSNLELVTQSENNKHQFRVLGRLPNTGATKFSKEIADAIRVDRLNGLTYNQLQEKHGVSRGLISDIINNKRWT